MPVMPMPGGEQGTESLFSLTADDTVRLTTVGIDIGSATSQLSFSRLELRRADGRYVVARRELVFESEVILTPYADSVTIDAGRLAAFIEAQYTVAGLAHDDVDCGALILTGLALAKARALVMATGAAAPGGPPLVAVLDGDVGGLVGGHVVRLGAQVPVVVLDGIDVSELDFLDIGEFIPGTGALPVVVKSLLFPNATVGQDRPAAVGQRPG